MQTTPIAVAETILKNFQVLPTIPAAAAKAVQLLNESEVDLDQVADVLLADQVITARVIRIINSPLYKLLDQVDSVKKALVYLGPQKIFEIILTSCFLELTDNKCQDGMRLQSCWEHSFGVALVARSLAEQNGSVPPEMAYVAGILHDIGEVILSQQRKEDFQQVLKLAHERELDLYQAEMEYFGASHSEVGALLAEHWRFPAPLVDVIQHHHNEEIENCSMITQIVALADIICTDVRLTCDVEGARYNLAGKVFGSNLLHIEQQLARMGVCDQRAFRDMLGGIVEKVKATVQTIYV